MPANYKAELVRVFGCPVAENPTGVMQEAAFAAAGLNWRYLTIPHKVAVLSLLDEVSPDAAMIGAVNTVRRVGDRLIGENTDGKGFLRGVLPNPHETRLIKAARAQGLKALNGLAMLVYQGAIAFEMWTGQKASEAVMKDALEKAFGGLTCQI